jgi:hypothetical protein
MREKIDHHTAEKLFADYFDNNRADFAYSWGQLKGGDNG